MTLEKELVKQTTNPYPVNCRRADDKPAIEEALISYFIKRMDSVNKLNTELMDTITGHLDRLLGVSVVNDLEGNSDKSVGQLSELDTQIHRAEELVGYLKMINQRLSNI